MDPALSRRAAIACHVYTLFPESINRRDFAYAVERADSFEDLAQIYQQAILITEQPPTEQPPTEPDAPTEFSNDCHNPETGEFCETDAPKNVDPATVEWWHGTPSGDLRGGAYGLHIGTKQAALEALNSRIGTPVEGEWDGTREYGKTLLAGQKTLLEREGNLTGYTFIDGQGEDHYPSGRAVYSDSTNISLTAKPNIIGVRIKGPMTNTIEAPMTDNRANGQMRGQITKGNAKRGYFYTNIGEDDGSISAVVPNGLHLEVIYDKSRELTASAELSNDCHSPQDGRFCETTGTGPRPKEVSVPEGLSGAALIDHLQATMGMVQTTDEHTNPERYEPNKAFGVHLKLGEKETHLEADTDHNPILVDYVSIPMKDAMSEVRATGKNFKELGILIGVGMYLLRKDPSTARPLPYVFRIVSEEDYQGALKRGYYQSDGRMNLVATEGTVTAGRALGTFYAAQGTNRFLRFKVTPAEGWKVDPNDEYIKTQKQIPISTIDLVSPPFEYDRKSGNTSLTASATSQLANTCHSPEDGKFCTTPGAKGHAGHAADPGQPSDVVKIYGDDPTMNAARAAIATIESVHGLPKAVYRPVLFKVSSSDNPLGEYSINKGSYADQDWIEVSSKGNHPELTFTHEFGHYIDHQYFVSRNDILPIIKESFAYRQLEGMKGQEMGYPNYLLDDKETFARAYAQYIATRSNDQILQAQVDRPRHEFGAKRDSQWEDKDFEPIAEAFDAMFASKGLLKKRTVEASAFSNDCHNPEDGRFCEGSSKVEKASPEERKKARAFVKAKVNRAPTPTPDQVQTQRAKLIRSRTEGRPGGESRGNSADRRARQLNLWEEFGGPKRGYVVDAATGVKMHYTDDPAQNPRLLPVFTQGKVFTTFQGGGYTLPNLIPELLRSNQRRGDRPIRKENLAA